MHHMAYPDRWFRLIGIPVWGIIYRHIGEPSPLINLLRDPVYYLDLAVAITVTAAMWEMNRQIILRMDRHFSWVGQTIQRLFVQGGLAYGLTGLCVLAISFVYNDLIIERPQGFNINFVFVTDIPVALLFVTILHLGYTMMWMAAYHRQVVAELRSQITFLEEHPELENNVRLSGKKTLLVRHGKGLVPVATEQIAYIFIAGELAVIKTADSKSYTLDSTLEQLEEQLPSDAFFRLNRQFIVNRTAIKKVENEGPGRLLLQLQPAHTESVTVSRRRAPEFRQWMEG